MIDDLLNRQKTKLRDMLAKKYLEREKLPIAKKMLDNNLIKVIVGPRRAGKSIFCLEMLKDRPFAYLNLDDEGLPPFLKDSKDYNTLIKKMFEHYGQTKYLFFDEIQNLEHWELFANRLQREGYNLILTGSNAKLLSRELTTHLTGRHYPLEILPFNFKEFLAAKNFPATTNCSSRENEGLALNYLKEYFQTGGYPEVVVDKIEVEKYLSSLLDAILFRDIVGRHNIRFPKMIESISYFLLNNVSSELSLRKLTNILKLRSVTTVEKYLEFLKETYLFFTLDRYSYKASERLTAPRKIYVVDNGYLTAKAVWSSANPGKLMENLIFTEMIKCQQKQNRDLFYYKTRNGREVDFAVKKGLKIICLIQSAFQIHNLETKKREVKALLEAGEELNCDHLIILTWDKEGIEKTEGKTIRFIPLWKWLTEENHDL